jgi:hypothetical protein
MPRAPGTNTKTVRSFKYRHQKILLISKLFVLRSTSKSCRNSAYRFTNFRHSPIHFAYATLTTQRGRQSRPPASRNLDDVQSPPQTCSRPQKRVRETIRMSSPPSDTPEEEKPPPPSKTQLQAIEMARLQDERVQHEEFAIIAITYLGNNHAYQCLEISQTTDSSMNMSCSGFHVRQSFHSSLSS